MPLLLKEIQVLREHKVAATGPTGATGGAGSTTTADHKVIQEHNVIQVLNEITLTPQGVQKVLLLLKEIQVLREHTMTVHQQEPLEVLGPPQGATDSKVIQAQSGSRR